MDNFRITPLYYRFQNRTYENYFDVADIPVGIQSNIEINKTEEEEEDSQ